MKQVILALLLVCTFGVIQAQTGSVPQNKVFNLDSVNKQNPKDPQSMLKNSTLTTNKAIYNGVECPVYQSKNGKLFILVKSKSTGNYYRKYLKTEEN